MWFETVLLVGLVAHQTVWSQTVNLKQGTARGSAKTVSGQTVFTFKGIPYAEPPIGIQRFRPATPHTQWEGIYSAIDFKPPCPQPTGSRVVRDTMDEDCLYLNIFEYRNPRVEWLNERGQQSLHQDRWVLMAICPLVGERVREVGDGLPCLPGPHCLTANSLTANSLTANSLTANSLTANSLAANSLTAISLTAKSVLGSLELESSLALVEGQLFTLGNPSDVPAEDFVADQDVVFVSLAYRVNAFGFLSFEDSTLPGNMGLTDQSLAISWVYENIVVQATFASIALQHILLLVTSTELFGGNRNQITLMGHSAGAASTLFHIISPLSSPRISRIIMMSGSGLAPWAIQKHPRANAQRLARLVGCSTFDSRDLLACLQGKQVRELISAVDDMIRDGNTSAIFGPVIDDFLPSNARFLEINPVQALERGLYKK
eukprot:maker-scaffold630_size122347-snap-gene-0.11 protein:Tk08028 transcript:maker-scaffold630_size122347-snap-gene-0.11-mRNA-1 annotation:"hypothetical protein DAPPUDRAFT_303775"